MKLVVAFLAVIFVAKGQIDPPEFIGESKKPRNTATTLQLTFRAELEESIRSSGQRELEVTWINEMLLPKISTFIDQHPEFGDAYVWRVLFSFCGGNRANTAMIADVDKAIQTFSGNGLFGALPEGYRLKARLEYDLGQYQAAMDDLERGVKLDPSRAAEIIKASGVKPESRADSEDPCVWTQTEIDDLANRFPKDYRVPLYRGIYLSNPSFDESLGRKAVDEFERALAVNPQSALAHYFIGEAYSRVGLFGNSFLVPDGDKSVARRRATREYTSAINLDRTFKDAFAGRANAYLGLGQYQAAVQDYNKVIELDSKDAGAFYDRAIAWQELGNSTQAIFDYSEAIRLGTFRGGLASLQSAYEARGDLRLKVGAYEKAVEDYSALIRLKLEIDSFAWSLKLFRELYPEYASLSDDTYVAKIHDLFWQDWEMEEFSRMMRENSDNSPLFFEEAYAKRAGVYLKLKRFQLAFADYNRAEIASGNRGRYASERWRSIGKSETSEQFIDMKTLEFGPIAKMWLKTTKTKGHDLDLFEIDCRAAKLRVVSSLMYDDDGKVANSSIGSSAWEPVVPDSMGEGIRNGMCRVE